MPIAHEFEYKKVTGIEDAVELLAEYGDKAKILAGGTDLTVHIKEDHIAPDLVIDIKGIEEFKDLYFDGKKLFIGANVTFSEIIKSQEVKDNFRMLWEASETVASVGIRNLATVAGNICSAVPSLDSAPALLAYDAKIHVQSSKAVRTIDIKEWFLGVKKTAIKPDELLTSITLSLPEEKSASCYKKLGRYAGEDLAQAGIGILSMTNKHYKIAVCAVGPVPKRAIKTEKFLNGKDLTKENIKEAQKIIETEISPITDIRASKEYRTHMIKIMLERGLKEAKALLEGEKIKSNPIIQ